MAGDRSCKDPWPGRSSPRKKSKVTAGSVGDEGMSGCVDEAAAADDGASFPSEQREGEVVTDSGDDVGEAASQEEVAAQEGTPARPEGNAEGGSSSSKAMGTPKF